VTCPSQSTSYHWSILNSCLLCGTLFVRLRLSCDNPFSWRSWGATAKRMSRRLTNVRRSLGIRTQKSRDWENTDCSIKEMRCDDTEEEHTVVLYSSSSTVDFRGLEGSDTKAEIWSATESRQIAEDDRELNNLVSENNGPLG